MRSVFFPLPKMISCCQNIQKHTYVRTHARKNPTNLRNRFRLRSRPACVFLFVQADKNQLTFHNIRGLFLHCIVYSVNGRHKRSPVCYGIAFDSLNWPMSLVKIRWQLKRGTAIVVAIHIPLHPINTMAIHRCE